MNKHRIIHSLVLRGSTLWFLLIFSTSSCIAPWTSRPSSIDSEVMVFGAKVGTLARTIQSKTLFIQAELAKPQPNVRNMQEAQAQILRAHLEQLPPAPEELYDLHDLWIEASFDCQYGTNLAVINLGGDLIPCLSEIDIVVKATEKYMSAQEKPTKSIP